MQNEEGKRGRGNQDEDDERAAKALLGSDRVRHALFEYESMTDEQRRALKAKGFSYLSLDLQKIIASIDVGIMLTMGRLNKAWNEIVGMDSLWQKCFARDFPREWAFCKGTLPVYVLHREHVLWVEGVVDPRDQSAWKRFYLHTANEYRKLVIEWIEGFVHTMPGMDIPPINVAWATSKEIYRWAYRVPMTMHLPFYDRRAELTWVWVVSWVWYARPLETNTMTKQEIVHAYWEFANQPGREWMLPYANHTHPGGIDDSWIQAYANNEEPEFDDWTCPDCGPALSDVYEFLGNAPQERRRWHSYLITHPPWQGAEAELFSASHDVLVSKLLAEIPGPDNVPANIRVSSMKRCLDMIAEAYRNPCLYTTGRHFIHSGMILYAKTLQTQVFPSVASNPRWKELFKQALLSGNDFIMFGSWEDHDRIMMICEPFYLMTQHGMHEWTIFRRIRGLAILALIWKHLAAPRSQNAHEKLLYIQQPLLACVSCGTASASLLQCGGTCEGQGAVYCGVACQRAHWHAEHSKECRKKE